MPDEIVNPPPDAATLFGDMSLDDVYAATLPEAEALTEGDLYVLNIDINTSIVTVSGCTPKLAQFRKEIGARLGAAVNMKYIDGLPRYAAALAQANRIHTTATETSAPLTQWGDALAAKHELLYGDAEALARHGLIEAARPVSSPSWGRSPFTLRSPCW